MAMFGLGVVVAPVMGPTIGALLTEYYSWRMVFFVNLPVAAMALLLMSGELPEDRPQRVRVDWTGLILLTLAIGALQFMLDQGQQRDWFSSRLIQSAAAISATGFVFFLIHGLSMREPIVDLRLFADRNFAMGNLVIAGFAVAMFGGIAILPLFVQGLLGYPVLEAGNLFIPRGLAAGFSMVITGAVLVPRVDARLLAAGGLLLTGLGNFMLGRLNLDASFWQLAWPGVVQALGMGLVFVPMSTLAFDRIGPDRQNEASGLYGVTRQIGSSVGIAIVAVTVVRGLDLFHVDLIAHITPYSMEARRYLAPLGLTPESPRGAAVLAAEVSRQAALMSYVRVFTMLGWLSLALMPFLLVMTKPVHQRRGGMAH
ncbi:MAG: hypothetical protein KatS3mg118_3238 [Paracoccaceae bacterium]|nr:MAG: hypothetical protein KatS3mg118_3238 [Paracoccaceae bacterium]